MQLSEDETIEKYGTECGQCNQKTFLLYQNEFT